MRVVTDGRTDGGTGRQGLISCSPQLVAQGTKKVKTTNLKGEVEYKTLYSLMEDFLVPFSK